MFLFRNYPSKCCMDGINNDFIEIRKSELREILVLENSILKCNKL